MKEFTIQLGENKIAEVSGGEAVWVCYEAAKAIADLTNQKIFIIRNANNKVIGCYDPEEVE